MQFELVLMHKKTHSLFTWSSTFNALHGIITECRFTVRIEGVVLHSPPDRCGSKWSAFTVVTDCINTKLCIIHAYNTHVYGTVLLRFPPPLYHIQWVKQDMVRALKALLFCV